MPWRQWDSRPSFTSRFEGQQRPKGKAKGRTWSCDDLTDNSECTRRNSWSLTCTVWSWLFLRYARSPPSQHLCTCSSVCMECSSSPLILHPVANSFSLWPPFPQGGKPFTTLLPDQISHPCYTVLQRLSFPFPVITIISNCVYFWDSRLRARTSLDCPPVAFQSLAHSKHSINFCRWMNEWQTRRKSMKSQLLIECRWKRFFN